MNRSHVLAVAALLLIWIPLAAPLPAANVSVGEQVYRLACADCHGPRGRGDGVKARRLGFRPPDFSLASFKCRCTPSGELPTDEDLQRVISRGLDGTAMMGFAETLTADEIRAVVAYLKTLVPDLATAEPTSCLQVPAPPPATRESISDGGEIYKTLGCWSCHGPSGRGDGSAAKMLTDERGEPIRPLDFGVLGKFKCGGSPTDFYRTLHTGFNGTPMASFGEAFLFARQNLPSSSVMAAVYDAEAVASYTSWAGRQPDAATLEKLSAADRQQLVERRTWALVGYIESLLRH